MEILKKKGGGCICGLCDDGGSLLAGGSQKDKQKFSLKFVGVMSRPAESSTAPEARFPAPEPGATEPEPETGARVSGGQARGARPSTVP